MFLYVILSFFWRILLCVVVFLPLVNGNDVESKYITITILPWDGGGIYNDNLTMLRNQDNAKSQLVEACHGYDDLRKDEVWAGILDENILKNGAEAIVLFECKLDTFVPSKRDYSLLLHRWIGQWQRNVLKGTEKTCMKGCNDEYGREIQMPMGIHRCVLHQEVESLPPPRLPRRLAHRGGNLLHLNTEMTCSPKYQWQTTNFTNPKYLPHGYCSVNVTLTKSTVTCCCYTDAKECAVGKNTDEFVVCPDGSLSLIYHSVTKTSNGSTSLPHTNSIVLRTHDVFKPECTFKFDVLRINRTNDFIVNSVAVRRNNSICNGEQFDGCWKRSKKCLNQTSPLRSYCCQFTAASAISRNIFQVQEIWGRFLRREIDEKLKHTKNCTFPFTHTGIAVQGIPGHACVYFIDPQERRFINVVLNQNFIVDYNFIQERSFTRLKNISIMQLVGRPTCQVCNDAAADTPPWYRMTIIAVICSTLDTDTIPCDHPRIRNKYLDTIIEDSKPQYECFHEHNFSQVVGNPRRIWDPICIESLVYTAPKEFVISLDVPNREDFLDPIWQDTVITTSKTYLCVKNRDKRTEHCVCLPKTGQSRHESCNTGTTIGNKHDIDESPIYAIDKRDSKRVCAFDGYKLNKQNQECGNSEKGRPHVCLFFAINNGTHSISCLKEPELSQRDKRWRSSNDKWNLYLMCRNHKSKNKPKCVLKDTQYGYYSSAPTVVCCCNAKDCKHFVRNFRSTFAFKTMAGFAEKESVMFY